MDLPKQKSSERLIHRQKLEKITKYAHFYIGDGVITVAGIFNYFPNNINEVEVLFGLAFCSPKDQWNKRKGREIAFERLLCIDRKTIRDCRNASQILTRSLPNVGLMLQKVTFDHLNTYWACLPKWLKIATNKEGFNHKALLFTKNVS